MASQETPTPSSASDFNTFVNTINGKSYRDGEVHQGIDPSTGEPLWPVPCATESTLNEAVIAANTAFRDWSGTSLNTRRHVLIAIRDRIATFNEELTTLLMKEVGRPPAFAALEVQHSIDFLNFHAKLDLPAERILSDDDEKQVSLHYVPVGVVAAICPWNYPMVLAIAKIAAALLTGNCVIIKPSPYSPYSMLKVVELVQDVTPPGVLQAVNGKDSLGPLMVQHPDIHKISFTGSSATGKRIMQAAASTLKSVTLELSGNDAAIICPDVDIQVIAPQVALGAFFNSGQLCLGTKRIYVHESIYEDFLQAFTNVVKTWKVGPSSMEGGMLGPVQNEMQYNIVKKFFEDSLKNGYKFALGDGTMPKTHGYVIQPAIVDNPPDHSMVVAEEAFGPIVPLMKWSTEEELLERVNATNTGLGGSVWSGNIEYAQILAPRMITGSVWINSFGKPLPQGHLAGWKESGMGGEWGVDGLLGYCKTQTIHYYKQDVRKKQA